jgi:hypothetical protein
MAAATYQIQNPDTGKTRIVKASDTEGRATPTPADAAAEADFDSKLTALRFKSFDEFEALLEDLGWVYDITP